MSEAIEYRSLNRKLFPAVILEPQNGILAGCYVHPNPPDEESLEALLALPDLKSRSPGTTQRDSRHLRIRSFLVSTFEPAVSR